MILGENYPNLIKGKRLKINDSLNSQISFIFYPHPFHYICLTHHPKSQILSMKNRSCSNRGGDRRKKLNIKRKLDETEVQKDSKRKKEMKKKKKEDKENGT